MFCLTLCNWLQPRQVAFLLLDKVDTGSKFTTLKYSFIYISGTFGHRVTVILPPWMIQRSSFLSPCLGVDNLFCYRWNNKYVLFTDFTDLILRLKWWRNLIEWKPNENRITCTRKFAVLSGTLKLVTNPLKRLKCYCVQLIQRQWVQIKLYTCEILLHCGPQKGKRHLVCVDDRE